jgi:hypothetical protein
VKVSLYVRASVKGERRYIPVNKKKIYPEGTIFCLRYARQWETLTADNLSTALAARAKSNRKHHNDNHIFLRQNA